MDESKSSLGTDLKRSRKKIAVAATNGREVERAKTTLPKEGKRKRVRISSATSPSATNSLDRLSNSYGNTGIIRLDNESVQAIKAKTERRNTKNYEDRYQAIRSEVSADKSLRGKRLKPKTNKANTKFNKPKAKDKAKSKARKGNDRFVTPELPKPIRYDVEVTEETEIRLNKFLSNAGVCSRREADQMIAKGLIQVNGEVISELGKHVSIKDTIVVDGKVVELQKKVYILLNKPKNSVTTLDDPEGRVTVMDIIKRGNVNFDERIYPVGRLDRMTTGVLLLTNDGDMAVKLTHPKFEKRKVYHVWLDKPVVEDDMQSIAEGIELEDGMIHADAISYIKDDDLSQVGIEIHSGRNRIVRRIFEALGYKVVKLDRVYFAGLTKKNLPRGKWRYLNEDEVRRLRTGQFE